MTKLIPPRTLKGFRDYLPAAAIPREALIATAVGVYRAYGFSPIDTPALEYAEILLGKGGDETEKQTYRFVDSGGREVALRFDLTVPLARYAAQHIGELGTPFKRYHVGTVWRGENTQRGRYREFLQCDFDTIGTDSSISDTETILVIHDVFQALGFTRFTIKVNDRRILNGLLELRGLEDRAAEVLRVLDKLPKVGPDRVRDELAAIDGVGPDDVEAVAGLAATTGSNREVLAKTAAIVGGNDRGRAGVAGLTALVDAVEGLDIAAGRIKVDVSIARGLDYYTGIVFEVFLDDLPDIGSCSSGGRYDDLASLYSKQRLPGVGGSLGVDRLLAAMEELGLTDARSTWAPVLVTVFDEDGRLAAMQTAAALRADDIGAEVYPEARKLGAQLKYADRKGHRVAVIAGPNERDAGMVQLKNLADGSAETVAAADVVAAVRRLLGR